jgi:hypothetical protein
VVAAEDDPKSQLLIALTCKGRRDINVIATMPLKFDERSKCGFALWTCKFIGHVDVDDV